MRTLQLEKAYLSTAYCIDPPGGMRITLRIGQTSPELREVLAGLLSSGVIDASCWAIITAANPGSRRLPDSENSARMCSLRTRLAAEVHECWPGENLAGNGDWPSEPTLFIPGLEKTEALHLAGNFGQNAIVVGDGSGIPELAWLAGQKQAPER